MLNRLKINPGFLAVIGVTFTLTLIIITAADIYLSYNDLLKSKHDEAVSLMRAVQRSGENAILSSRELENQLGRKLVSCGYLLAKLQQKSLLNQNEVDAAAASNDIDHICIYSDGSRPVIISSNKQYQELNVRNRYAAEIDSVEKGKFEAYIAGGLTVNENNEHLIVIHRRGDGKPGYILLSVDSEQLRKFRRKMGAGMLLTRIAENKDIEYIVVQDSAGFINSSRTVKNLSSFVSDPFLSESIKKGGITARETDYNGRTVYETIKPFWVDNELAGIVRIGMSLEPVRSLLKWTIIRSILLSLLLLLTGLVIIIYFGTSRRFASLNRAFQRVQNYTDRILDNMSDAVVAADSRGNISMLNKAAERLFGIAAKDVKGKDTGSLLPGNDNLIHNTLEKGKPVEYAEQTVKMKSGKEVLLGGGTSIIYSESGVDSVIAVLRDITAQKYSEEIARRNEKNNAMGQLAAGVAHEIKNPLNLLSIATQRLEKEFEPALRKENYSELLKRMKKEINRVTNIINQFLSFARPPEIVRKEVNLRKFLNDVVYFFRGSAASRSIELVCKCDDMFADIDHEQLRQALVNLIQNAMEAVSDGGKIEIVAEKEGGLLTISVSDNGCGIKKEEINRIFNLYYTTRANGTGLGLSIVNRIVTEHGGSIRTESTEGSGTVFTMEIPVGV